MDTEKLIAVGLQPLQAEVYSALLGSDGMSPPLVARQLKLTRTNAYKVLDKLVELGLAERVEVRKKLVYRAANPMNLISMLGEERNSLTAREEIAKGLLDQLLAQYHQSTDSPDVQVATGRAEVIRAYRSQIAIGEPLYFIRSKADIPTMGYDTMHDIRVLPAHHGLKRYGITPDVLHGTTNPEADSRSNLKRTWVKLEDYTAPVEWSVCGPTLLIVIFASTPCAITITNGFVAEAFRQLWHLIDKGLKYSPDYNHLPRANE